MENNESLYNHPLIIFIVKILIERKTKQDRKKLFAIEKR